MVLQYAMCGPFDTASPLGPGMDAVSVPASSSSSEEQAEKGAQKTAGTVDVGDNLAKVCGKSLLVLCVQRTRCLLLSSFC